MKISEAIAISGTLGEPSKMPGYSYGLPAQNCITGAKLHNVPDTVCRDCYALKGNYIFKGVRASQANRLASITHPLWIDAMVTLITSKLKSSKRDAKYFRWHDSGDLQSVSHLENICEIARRLPSVSFWLPTREYSIVREHAASGKTLPDNLNVRLSAHIVDGPLPTKLAEQVGCTVSGVHTGPQGQRAPECEAHTRGNQCGDCRACWFRNIPAISYLKH